MAKEEHDDTKDTILVVEDDRELLSRMIDILKEQFTVYHAVNGKLALKKTTDHSRPGPHFIGYYDAGDERPGIS